MKAALAALGVLILAGLGLWYRHAHASPVALQVGPATTVISGPLTPGGGVDFDAAMKASDASEQRLETLLATLERMPGGDCERLDDPTRAQLTVLLREPLRMKRPASHVTEASQLLATRMMLLMRRVLCSCQKDTAHAAEGGNVLAAVSAHLSSSNQDTFYQLHALTARAATGCFLVAPANATREIASLRFYDMTDHLELVRLGMLEEIMNRADVHFDVNVALRTFNEDFMRAVNGGTLQPAAEPTPSFWQSADAIRESKSAFVGHSFAQQVPEIVEAARTAHENTANDRRAWSGE